MSYSFAGNAATYTASIIILVTEMHVDLSVKDYNLLAFNILNVLCL